MVWEEWRQICFYDCPPRMLARAIQGVHCGSGWAERPRRPPSLGSSVGVRVAPGRTPLGCTREQKSFWLGFLLMLPKTESADEVKLNYSEQFLWSVVYFKDNLDRRFISFWNELCEQLILESVIIELLNFITKCLRQISRKYLTNTPIISSLLQWLERPNSVGCFKFILSYIRECIS